MRPCNEHLILGGWGEGQAGFEKRGWGAGNLHCNDRQTGELVHTHGHETTCCKACIVLQLDVLQMEWPGHMHCTMLYSGGRHLSCVCCPSAVTFLSQYICIHCAKVECAPLGGAQGMHGQRGHVEGHAPHVKGAYNWPALKQIWMVAHLHR